MSVSAGQSHTCAVRATGELVCWGFNSNCELGDGTLTTRTQPVSVPGVSDLVEVDAGTSFTCVRHGSGTVSCWGVNTVGQLGRSTVTTQECVPAAVSGVTDAVNLSAGIGSVAAHVCAVRATGAVVCWGRNDVGQLGNGTTGSSSTPLPVLQVHDAREVACGELHTCASQSNGAVACWGFGSEGQIGDGTTHTRTDPELAIAPASGADLCISGPPLVDDANPCTADSCDPGSGPVHTPLAAGTPCDDACTAGMVCDGSGVCGGGSRVNIDDGNVCTTDACNPSTGAVTHVPMAGGTSCSDGDACDGAETCSSTGTCLAGTAVPITSDGNECTFDECDPATGNIIHPPVPSGTPCEDGDACTIDICDAGACAVHDPLPIDDDEPCTVDSCDPATGVVHTPLPAGTRCGAFGTCDSFATCREEICNDTLDNDLDGPADCDDTDCLAEAYCVFTPPPIDRSVVTSFLDSVGFLFDAEDPIQRDLDPQALVAKHAALVRGRVLDLAGLPLSRVFVAVLGRPEFGNTRTRAEGEFDMVVNGGGDLTIEFSRPGYIPVQRRATVLWEEAVTLDDIVMMSRDTAVTEVTLGAGATEYQVAQGSVQTDAQGSRQGTVLIPPGLTAGILLPNGTSTPLDTMDVRITEFTVGDAGPAAMPLALPPTSRYTYAFDITADEAIAGGVKIAGRDVLLSQPVPVYVENFLGFPVGTGIPAAYADNDAGVWKAVDNGGVVKILGVTAGLADLDTDGDDVADDAATLATFAITDHERAKLATLYAVGQTLWRVRIPHFSTWDANMGSGISLADANKVPPGKPPPVDDNDPKECTIAGASTIECSRRVLRESAPVAGTPFTLNYESDRTLGYAADRHLRIPLKGAEFATLGDAAVSVVVEPPFGVATSASFTKLGTPDEYVYDWNGLDGFNHQVQARQEVRVTVGYDYFCNFSPVNRFGNYSGPATLNVSPEDLARGGRACSVQRKYTLPVQQWDNRPLGLGGWSLSVHHAIDREGMVRFGDGTHSRASAIKENKTLAGSQGATSGVFTTPTPVADAKIARGTPAGPADYYGPTTRWPIEVGPDGAMYVVEGGHNMTARVQRIKDGFVTTVAGGAMVEKAQCIASRVDGQAAVGTLLCGIMDLAVDSQNNVYLAESDQHSEVSRVTPPCTSEELLLPVAERTCGKLHKLAGMGSPAYAPDGSIAANSPVSYPGGVAVDTSGRVYFSECRLDPSGDPFNPYRVGFVRMILPGADGATLVTVAGNGQPATGPTPTGPVDALSIPWRCAAGGGDTTLVEVDPQGGFYTVDGVGVRHVDANRNHTLVATGAVRDIQLDKEGNLYLIAGPGGLDPSWMLKLKKDGVPSTLLGVTSPLGTLTQVANLPGQAGDASCGLSNATGVALSPNDTVHWTQDCSLASVVYTAVRARALSATAEQYVASDDGREVYLFDGNARHVETRDARTGARLYAFGYAQYPGPDGEAESVLSQVLDGDGNLTNIERDVDGKPTAFVGPYGHRTELTLNLDGYLATVRPDASQPAYAMTYHGAEGLLATFTTPQGKTSAFAYDALGRLETDTDAAMAVIGLTTTETTSTPSSRVVTETSGEGRATSYVQQGFADGSRQLSVHFPDGTQNTSTTTSDTQQSTTMADGTLVTQVLSSDPRWQMQAPVSTTTTRLPSP